MTHNVALYTELVDYLGGQCQAARKLKIQQASVWGWVNGRSGMGPFTAQRAEKITNGAFRAQDLCPRLAEI